MDRSKTTGPEWTVVEAESGGMGPRSTTQPHAPVPLDTALGTGNASSTATPPSATGVALSNYSAMEATQQHDGPPSGSRAAILRQPISPAAQVAFQMPLKQWLTVDREKLPPGAYTPPRSRAVDVSDLTPLGVDFLRGGGEAAERLEEAIRGKCFVFRGPVTALRTDAIVNAANQGCLGGGGVDAAVHSGAGALLLRECATFNGAATGHTRITKGYNLPARAVLHTVGPIGERPGDLRSCYGTCMSLSRRWGVRSVGFCCVSTGIFGYPLAAATKIALETTIRQLYEHPKEHDAVVWACFRAEEAATYEKLFPRVAQAVADSLREQAPTV